MFTLYFQHNKIFSTTYSNNHREKLKLLASLISFRFPFLSLSLLFHFFMLIGFHMIDPLKFANKRSLTNFAIIWGFTVESLTFSLKTRKWHQFYFILVNVARNGFFGWRVNLLHPLRNIWSVQRINEWDFTRIAAKKSISYPFQLPFWIPLCHWFQLFETLQ